MVEILDNMIPTIKLTNYLRRKCIGRIDRTRISKISKNKEK